MLADDFGCEGLGGYANAAVVHESLAGEVKSDRAAIFASGWCGRNNIVVVLKVRRVVDQVG